MKALASRNLDKFDFLEDNKSTLFEYLDDINQILKAEYGEIHKPVTMVDVWVITYVEAGLKSNGHIDPRFRHSRGEIGLYPLPSNIRDWNGDDAPPWNRFSTLELNVHHYFLYLGHLKNKFVKTIDGMKLYVELFSSQSTTANVHVEAEILAGVVHGYFFEGNYPDGVVPLQHLIDGYKSGVKLSTMMASTRYKHAGTTIISNRERNIDSAMRDSSIVLSEK